MLFISNNGLLSKESSRNISIDLINVRDSLFAPSDYYYNIMRWKSISVSYKNDLSEITAQSVEFNFEIPFGETSAVDMVYRLPEYFVGNLDLTFLRIYDYDNGFKSFKASELASIPSLNVETDLEERPSEDIIDQDNDQNVYISLDNIGSFKEGYKVRLEETQKLEPLLTIDSVNTETGLITFDQPFGDNTVGKKLAFAFNAELVLDQLIKFKS